MRTAVVFFILASGISISITAATIPKCAVQVPGKTADEITLAEIALVEHHMNESSADAACLLSEQMTGLILLNPRVSSLYAEIIKKSTKIQNVRAAVRGIEAASREDNIPAKKRTWIANVLQAASKRDDTRTKLNAARALARLDDSFQPKAEEIVRDVLRDYNDGKSIGQEVMSYRLPFYSDSELDLSLAILQKDPDERMVSAAIQNIDGYIKEYKAELTHGARIPQIASALQSVSSRKDAGILVRTDAAEALANLGGDYQEASYAAKFAALVSPCDLSDAWARRKYEATLLDVLRDIRPSDQDAIRKAVLRNHAVEAVNEDVKRNAGDTSLAELSNRLRSLVESERK